MDYVWEHEVLLENGVEDRGGELMEEVGGMSNGGFILCLLVITFFMLLSGYYVLLTMDYLEINIYKSLCRLLFLKILANCKYNINITKIIILPSCKYQYNYIIIFLKYISTKNYKTNKKFMIVFIFNYFC